MLGAVEPGLPHYCNPRTVKPQCITVLPLPLAAAEWWKTSAHPPCRVGSRSVSFLRVHLGMLPWLSSPAVGTILI